ncbi:MAG: hypothetical protein GJT30_00930 [Geobacter sp.]|nr:hypothetical protein [Geobacter sp.]
MRRICAWCGVEIKRRVLTDREVGTVDGITHGICEECLFRHFGKSPKSFQLQEFVDEFEAPVVVVDASMRVMAANTKYLAIIGQDVPIAAETVLPEVFICKYTKLPGGCGDRVHSSGCAIRRAVTDAHVSGEGKEHVPAYLHRGDKTQLLQLSTEKLTNVVLVRIEHFPEVAKDSV